MDKKIYEANPKGYWEIPGLDDKEWGFTGLADRKDHPLFDEFIFPEITDFGVCADLGCGAGRYTGYAAEVFRKVLAIDFSKHSLNECKQLMESAHIDNVEYHLDDLSDMSDIAGESVDFAFTGVVFTHIPNEIKRKALREVSRIMKRGATVCLVEVFQDTNDAFDCPSVTHEEWQKMIEDAGMKIVREEPVWSLTKYVIKKI